MMISMLYLRDKPDNNWSTLSNDIKSVIFEDGEVVPLTPERVRLTFWAKYKGMKLSEVDDVRDLKWLASVAKEKDEGFCEMMFNMRLKEIEYANRGNIRGVNGAGV